MSISTLMKNWVFKTMMTIFLVSINFNTFLVKRNYGIEIIVIRMLAQRVLTRHIHWYMTKIIWKSIGSRKTPTIKHLSGCRVLDVMIFLLSDFALSNQNIFLFLTSHLEKYWKQIRQKYQCGYLNNCFDWLKTFLHFKNSSEIVPHANKQDNL